MRGTFAEGCASAVSGGKGHAEGEDEEESDGGALHGGLLCELLRNDPCLGQPRISDQPLPEAGAKRRLEAVSCTPLFGMK